MKVMQVGREAGAFGVLRRALAERPDVVVAPLEGGAAALLFGRVGVVSLLSLPPVDGGRGSLLERRQARRSTLLLAPDRPVGVACAQRWHLDLARIRVVPDRTAGLNDYLTRELCRTPPRKRAWHSQ